MSFAFYLSMTEYIAILHQLPHSPSFTSLYFLSFVGKTIRSIFSKLPFHGHAAMLFWSSFAPLVSSILHLHFVLLLSFDSQNRLIFFVGSRLYAPRFCTTYLVRRYCSAFRSVAVVFFLAQLVLVLTAFCDIFARRPALDFSFKSSSTFRWTYYIVLPLIFLATDTLYWCIVIWFLFWSTH